MLEVLISFVRRQLLELDRLLQIRRQQLHRIPQCLSEALFRAELDRSHAPVLIPDLDVAAIGQLPGLRRREDVGGSLDDHWRITDVALFVQGVDTILPRCEASRNLTELYRRTRTRIYDSRVAPL